MGWNGSSGFLFPSRLLSWINPFVGGKKKGIVRFFILSCPFIWEQLLGLSPDFSGKIWEPGFYGESKKRKSCKKWEKGLSLF